MSPLNADNLALANSAEEKLAKTKLLPQFAKLYSQFTKLNADGEGINWSTNETASRTEDAILLVQTGILLKASGNLGYKNCFRRAAELFEWLDHPRLNTNEIPMRLLAAALYQLAGYPARAGGVLNKMKDSESEILRLFLKGQFASLFKCISTFWSQNQQRQGLNHNEVDTYGWIQSGIINETLSAVGILNSELRWGLEVRTSQAMDKLDAISKVLMDSSDVYSWLLSKLFADVAREYIGKSMRSLISEVGLDINTDGQIAIERYLRLSYSQQKVIAWASQEQGVRQLSQQSSFALCTPTGSGKTTVAELAIISNLFSISRGSSSLIIYLVPSRALAVEVETKLSRILRRISDERIIVTGLYGGTEWGPTDAWLTSDQRTVLICTYEKTDALIRMLGTAFLSRVSLLIIDEAHNIQFNGTSFELQTANSRPLRLEGLAMRLFRHLEDQNCQKIALSAVVSATDESLAEWITSERDSEAIKTSYRSTRQLIGRLECMNNRGYQIRYDLLDGQELKFNEGGRDNIPYIPSPFPPCPPAEAWETPKSGLEVRIRPHVLWAAANLAASDTEGGAVLISITQNIDWYTKDFWELLSETWAHIELPPYFSPPVEAGKKKLWERCLGSCEDYFGVQSLEYKLLNKGIIVHHSKMPGLMSRCMVEAVQEGIVSIVLATSTLSEGINLPFRTILIPSLRRMKDTLPVQEFKNLVGRAGRPGNGTEGRALILMLETANDPNRRKYGGLLHELVNGGSSVGNSPMIKLMELLKEKWMLISGSRSQDDFFSWLEITAPLDEFGQELSDSVQTLDSLDAILLAAISEIGMSEMDDDVLEQNLQTYWRKSYAHFSAIIENDFEEIFVRRGKALVNTIYPDNVQRRKLYKTSLPPSAGNRLLEVYPDMVSALNAGSGYLQMSRAQKLDFIRGIMMKIGEIPRFKYEERRYKKIINWQERLEWWLSPTLALSKPQPKDISIWHDYIRKNFVNRFNWGFGSIIGLVFEQYYQETGTPPSLENWSSTGLPWIAYWMKELIDWGTLDPVAAYILSIGLKHTRQDAEAMALNYYSESAVDDPNELLNAISIRGWAEQFQSPNEELQSSPALVINCQLISDSVETLGLTKVLPVTMLQDILWVDAGGFELAKSQKPENWSEEFITVYDFILNPSLKTINSSHYLKFSNTEAAIIEPG